MFKEQSQPGFELSKADKWEIIKILQEKFRKTFSTGRQRQLFEINQYLYKLTKKYGEVLVEELIKSVRKQDLYVDKFCQTQKQLLVKKYEPWQADLLLGFHNRPLTKLLVKELQKSMDILIITGYNRKDCIQQIPLGYAIISELKTSDNYITAVSKVNLQINRSFQRMFIGRSGISSTSNERENVLC